MEKLKISKPHSAKPQSTKAVNNSLTVQARIARWHSLSGRNATENDFRFNTIIAGKKVKSHTPLFKNPQFVTDSPG